VVTCFLLRSDLPTPQLLLVRRSNRVGSYQGHWAGVSGFIEPNVSPEEQAYTEILEETGLARGLVRLLKRGGVVEYIDEEIGRHFFVHPFLFAVSTPILIRTDWEATEMCWIEPADLPSFTTVPRLREAYVSALNGTEPEEPSL
jgi:ADP-ribose pyrophosphatase YjhB (NUDIX family)